MHGREESPLSLTPVPFLHSPHSLFHLPSPSDLHVPSSSLEPHSPDSSQWHPHPHPEVLGHGEGDPRTSTIKAQSGPNLMTSGSPSPQSIAHKSTAHKPGARPPMGWQMSWWPCLLCYVTTLLSIWTQQPPKSLS